MQNVASLKKLSCYMLSRKTKRFQWLEIPISKGSSTNRDAGIFKSEVTYKDPKGTCVYIVPVHKGIRVQPTMVTTTIAKTTLKITNSLFTFIHFGP